MKNLKFLLIMMFLAWWCQCLKVSQFFWLFLSFFIFCIEMARSDYIKKLDFIGGTDPYALKLSEFDVPLDDIPKISKNIILDYFLFSVSPSTYFEIRACKSLDAFAQLACKWIESLCAKKLNNNFLIFGKVRHSQRVSETPLKPWVVVSENGAILTAHCTCVAGLGEVCTHVASVLFALEFAGTRSDEKSVTDVLAYWIGPSKKGQFYRRLADIEFSTPKKLLMGDTGRDTNILRKKKVPSLSKSEMDSFTQKMIDLDMMPAYALANKEFNPVKTLDEKFPISLLTLFEDQYVDLDLEELRSISKRMHLSVTADQALAVFEATTKQSEEKLWFEFRAGRITASKFKSACHTRIEKPAMSLIRSICYPASQKKIFRAGVYGCRHEKDALKAYIDAHKKQHKQAHVEDCGLIINVDYPFFGATPDGFLHCEECGTGCIEVKCPYCVRDVSAEEIIQFKSSCLVIENEDFVLDRKHSYFYQVQMQLALSTKPFCDFVVWTPKSFICQRIFQDEDFWLQESAKAKRFFEEVLMPELLGQYYTRKQLNKPKNTGANKVQETEESIPSTSHHDNSVYHQEIDFQGTEESIPSTSPHDNSVYYQEIDFQDTEESIPSTSSKPVVSQIPASSSKPDDLQMPSTSSKPDASLLWCYCEAADDGTKMVSCDNPGCKIQWFHRRCIQIKRLPKGKWFCKNCSRK